MCVCVQVSFVVVNNAAIEESAYWALANALLTLLSDTNVQVLTVVASLHLPYAKPSTTAAIPNVYHSVLNVDASDNSDDEDVTTSPLPTNGASFQPVDSAWEIKDRFFATLVHFLKVEQSPRAHFLLTKGYKPGRDHAGTYEVRTGISSSVGYYLVIRINLTLYFIFTGGGCAHGSRDSVHQLTRDVRRARDRESAPQPPRKQGRGRERAAPERAPRAALPVEREFKRLDWHRRSECSSFASFCLFFLFIFCVFLLMCSLFQQAPFSH